MRVKELVELIKQEDFELILGVFLDEFNNSKQKQELINDEPEYLDDRKAQMCFLASTVHKLSNDNNLKCPDWIFKDKYYLKKSKYAFDTKDEEFKQHLRKVSPLEFSSRNYYVTENTLTRV